MAEEEKPPFPLLDAYKDTESFADPKNEFQSRNHRIYRRLPSPREVGEGEIVFSVVAGIRRMHAKLDGMLVSTVLT